MQVSTSPLLLFFFSGTAAVVRVASHCTAVTTRINTALWANRAVLASRDHSGERSSAVQVLVGADSSQGMRR